MKYLIYTAVVLLLCSCTSIKGYGEDLRGNIYTQNGKCEKWTPIYINALRIEEIKDDSIYVRLQLGKESFSPLSLMQSKNQGLYISKRPVNFYGNRKTYKSFIQLNFSENNTISLMFKDSLGVEKTLQYVFTKKDSIDKDKIRNVYHSEDGFNLCE